MEALIGLLALTAMEIVLGIDNIVFIAILTGRLPEAQRASARTIGLMLALGMRIVLLFTLTWVLGLTEPIFSLTSLGLPESIVNQKWFGEEVNEVSIRDLILLVGGLFLIAKSVHEIHVKLEGEHESKANARHVSFVGVLIQIALLDIIFSLDSVITAVGMIDPSKIYIMVIAIILAVIVMLIFSGKISYFVERHPTLKILALSFLILIGVMLFAEGVGTQINKGYIYFAMAFALAVEFLNLRLSRHATPTSGDATGVG